jgi:hypothetical protein
MVYDTIELDIHNPTDRFYYDLISPNSNNFPPQTAMTFKAHAAHIYGILKRQNLQGRMYDLFNPHSSTYNKLKAYKGIRVYKTPASSKQCSKILCALQEKIMEGDPTISSFRTLSDALAVKQSDSLFSHRKETIKTVPYEMVHRDCWNLVAENAGTTNKTWLVLRIDTTNFTISQDALNNLRWKTVYNTSIKASLYSEYAKFRKVGIAPSFVENVPVLGFYTQHGQESDQLIARIDEQKNYQLVTVDEAFALGNMVSY